jgi:hypothetical protein
MPNLSQSLARLSIFAAVCAGTVAFALPADAGKPTSTYYGRWTVDEEKPIFTARGRLYKTIDVAPCGKDFCGVSVDDGGKCGAVLFRFLGVHAQVDTLRGHGRWGNEQKNVVIYSYGGDPDSTPGFTLYLGDGYNLGERSGNMPKFHAGYRRLGGAKCVAR